MYLTDEMLFASSWGLEVHISTVTRHPKTQQSKANYPLRLPSQAGALAVAVSPAA